LIETDALDITTSNNGMALIKWSCTKKNGETKTKNRKEMIRRKKTGLTVNPA